MQRLIDNGNQHVSGHCATGMRLDYVFAVVQKLLDSQVLFDPFDKQLDLLTALVLSRLQPQTFDMPVIIGPAQEGETKPMHGLINWLQV